MHVPARPHNVTAKRDFPNGNKVRSHKALGAFGADFLPLISPPSPHAQVWQFHPNDLHSLLAGGKQGLGWEFGMGIWAGEGLG